MDHGRFDKLTRRLGTGVNRRTTVRLAGAGFLATIGLASGQSLAVAGELEAQACVPNGNRCGKQGQPKCAKCCSRSTFRQKQTQQRRCTCRADFRSCRRPDQCCSGICDADPCGCEEEAGKKVCIPGLFGSPPAVE